jgi:hypothetical protein
MKNAVARCPSAVSGARRQLPARFDQWKTPPCSAFRPVVARRSDATATAFVFLGVLARQMTSFLILAARGWRILDVDHELSDDLTARLFARERPDLAGAMQKIRDI